MKTYRLFALIVVSVVVAVLLATALANITRVSDSALADVATPGAGVGAGLSRPSVAGTNYLPIIFLNSATAGGAWLLAGNAGTNSLTDFLGTTDNMTLTLRVSNTVALRIAPTDETPNVIGGFSANSISGSVNHGSVIGGGGSPIYGTNTIQGGDTSYSTISGGVTNLISGTTVYNSVIGGGANNVISGSFAVRATIGGGAFNRISGTNAYLATIGGGSSNTAGNVWVTIGGGDHNIATSDHGTIAGGGYNSAIGSNYSTIGGGYGNIANAQDATIAGGSGNTANGFRSGIGGGNGNFVAITGTNAFIGGGTFNTASDAYSTVGGGYVNTASAYAATVPGGELNLAGGNDSFAAGCHAKANNAGAFVWADNTCTDFSSTANNQFLVKATGGVGIGTPAPGAASQDLVTQQVSGLTAGATYYWKVTADDGNGARTRQQGPYVGREPSLLAGAF